MKRTLLLSLLTLAVLGGVASADRHRGWGRGHGRWSAGVRINAPRIVVSQPRVIVQPRPVYVQRTQVVRRPIYVSAPRLRVRYYNYYQQPTVLAENYPARDGYYWVAGQWQWSGYEWRWTAGHYEPDPNYVEPYANPGYDYNYDTSVAAPGYSYDNSYNNQPCDHDDY